MYDMVTMCLCACRDVVLGLPLVSLLVSAAPRCCGPADAGGSAETPEGTPHHPAAGQRGIPGLSQRSSHHQSVTPPPRCSARLSACLFCSLLVLGFAVPGLLHFAFGLA